MSLCDCPEDKWPAEDCGPNQTNQTLPTTVRQCSILVSRSCTSWGCGSKSTRIKGGDCHPKYVFCEETQTCNPLLYSACGYSNWLRNFNLEGCVQQSPRRLMKTCVEDYLKEN